MGIFEGVNPIQNGSLGRSRIPPVHFIVNPGDTEVVAKFASCNPGVNTRFMTTTVIISKSMNSRQQAGTNVIPIQGQAGVGYVSSGEVGDYSYHFVFCASMDSQDRVLGGGLSQVNGGCAQQNLQADSIDAQRMTVTSTHGYCQSLAVGDELGKIILAIIAWATHPPCTMKTDPIKEDYTYEADDEASDQE